MTKIYVGDVGTEFQVECGTSVASASAMELRAKKPSGAEVAWSAQPFGATGIKYTTVAADLDEAGTWVFQAYLKLGTWEGLGEAIKQKVYAAFTL